MSRNIERISNPFALLGEGECIAMPTHGRIIIFGVLSEFIATMIATKL